MFSELFYTSTGAILLCSIFGVLIGSPKGRKWEGLALGFLFGPIGVLVIALMEPPRYGRPPRTAQGNWIAGLVITACAALLAGMGWFIYQVVSL